MSTRSIEAMHNLDATTLEEIMSAVIDIPEIRITPINNLNGSYRTGGLKNITKAQIIDVLGFAPNVEDDPDKVINSWAFNVNGKEVCAIWDYKGSHIYNRWSFYDPAGVIPALFDQANIDDGGW
jgi:hypothetical protein